MNAKTKTAGTTAGASPVNLGIADGLSKLVAGHEAVARTARGLFPTADLLTQRLAVHEQTASMLRSLLEE